MTPKHHPIYVDLDGYIIDSLDKLIHLVVELMLMDGKYLGKVKGGKEAIKTKKVVAQIMRDEALRKAYIELCQKKLNHETIECMDDAPIIVRNYLLYIAKHYATPVGKYLRTIILKGQKPNNNIQTEIVEYYKIN